MCVKFQCERTECCLCARQLWIVVSMTRNAILNGTRKKHSSENVYGILGELNELDLFESELSTIPHPHDQSEPQKR